MQIIAGPEGIPCLEITHKSGASALASLHGGHLLSWKTADGLERLYLSEKATYAEGTAIRGGVPVIFPQFSDRGPFARHGFARRMEWALVEGGDPATGLMQFTSSPATLAEWPHPFELRLGLELDAEAVTMRMKVTNCGDEAFLFDAAFHTYLRVGNLEQASVHGLGGMTFRNEVTKQIETDGKAAIRFGSEVDRSYSDAGECLIELREGAETLHLTSTGFPEAVVWNPGPEHGIGDLPDDGWEKFVCVEAARIQAPTALLPGESWCGSQRIAVEVL
jgi:glucose-6-phosphate 1-epimerase